MSSDHHATRQPAPRPWLPNLHVSIVFTIIVLGLSAPAPAQVQQASLEGTVADSSGSPLPGVTVNIRSEETNQTRDIVTDAKGTFRFGKISSGIYELNASLSGFRNFEQNHIQIAVGQLLQLKIKLVLASVTETLEVTAQPTALRASEPSPSTLIDSERIEELPVQSRNYLEFVLLAPGVTSTGKDGRSSAARSGLPDSGFSFAGLRPRSNNLTIDGLENNDEYSGSTRTELSLETIKEFQIVNHSWSAENGGGSGGSINVVTKSGVNIIHGDAFLIGQTGRFNSAPSLEQSTDRKPELARYRAGLSAGGPLLRDRTFFFVAGEREKTDSEGASNISTTVVERINRETRSWPSSTGLKLTSGLFPTKLEETELSAKIDHQLTPGQSIVGRVAATDNRTSADAFNVGGLVDLSSRGTRSTADLAGTGSWMSIVGETSTNELRLQLAHRREDLRTADEKGVGIVIPGVVEFGRPYAGNSDHDQQYLELADTFAVGFGDHYLKFGEDLTTVHLTGNDTDGFGGLFVFRSLGDFTAHRPEQFRRVAGDPHIDIRATRYALFCQDDWTPRQGLSVSAGARMDGEVLPARLKISTWQLSPRLGFAWTPDARWVVRGGAGFFADRLPLAALERALTVNGTSGFEQIVDDGAAASAFGDYLRTGNVSLLSGAAPSVYTVQRGRWDSSSRQASVGIERLLTADTTVSANYLFARGHHLLRTVNTNLLPPVILTNENAAELGYSNPTPQQLGRPVFGRGRVDPTRGDIFELQPTASSTYNGLTVAINRRLARELEWSIAYTLSKATDDASDFDEQPANPYAISEDRGPSRYDQRHRLTASALFDLGDTDDAAAGVAPSMLSEIFGNIEIAPILSIDSGRTVNALTGFDDKHSHALPSVNRPAGYGRNRLRLPPSTSLNLRVLKFFAVRPHGKLDLVVEAFNVFNSRNVTGVNPVFGESTLSSPGFGRPTDAAPARQIEFSIDLEF